MRQKTPIPFASWEPDRGELQAPQVARGVLSKGGRYIPWSQGVVYKGGTPMNGAAIGAETFYATSGVASTFLGDATKLYRMMSGVPTDVSKPGGYAADADWAWQFVQFGDNIVAVAGGVTPQRYILGSSSLFNNLNGSPPPADTAARVRQWLFLGKDRTVSLSGVNDITDWTYDIATSGLQTTVGQEAGRITKIIGGENGAIFQERGIVRVGFAGGSIPFVFDEVEGGRGCASPNGVSVFGRVAYCVAEDGFYLFNGLETGPLGAGRVDAWWTERLNYGYRSRITTAFDARLKTWFIGYPTGGSTIPNEILAYNIVDQRWSYCEQPHSLLFEMPYEGVNADDDTAIAQLVGTSNADEIDISMDSPIWSESRRQWAMVGEDRIVSLFTGSPRAATMSTSVFEPVPGTQTFATEIWPVCDADAGDVTGTIHTRLHRQSEAEATDSAVMIDEGFCPVRAEGRYARVSLDIAAGADWTEASGVHVDGSTSGGR